NMKHFALILVASVLTWVAGVSSERAQATTMTATVCAVGVNPCPAGSILDSGIRTNFVGTLLPNRYAVLPFIFADAFTSVTGTVIVGDIAGKYIYLVGYGQASSDIVTNIDIVINQDYVTTPGLWTF